MLRLRQVALVASDRDRIVDQLTAVFDLGPAYDDPHIRRIGLHNAVVPLGDQFVEVVAPIEDGTTQGRYLERRGGDAGYMLIFQTDDHAARSRRVEELGVRIVARYDAPGFTNIQLHPADVGGTLLEIDEQEDDGWSPAGPDWRSAVRTTVATGLSRAVVACADPAGVAARWADLLGVAAPAGHRPNEVVVDDAVLELVDEPERGRQGIVGVDVRCSAVQVAVDRARSLGLLHDDGAVHISGVAFRPVPAETAGPAPTRRTPVRVRPPRS